MAKNNMLCYHLHDFYRWVYSFNQFWFINNRVEANNRYFPPLTEESWNQEFDKYKESPEYLKINNSIEIKEFKSIFWVEFIHRIAGRITGILYCLPLLYFLVIIFLYIL